MIRRLVKDSVRKRVLTHIRGRYAEVQVKAEQGLFNDQCFNNCVEYCRTHEGFGIVECVYIEHGNPILHYINVKDGEYYEVSLGWKAERLEYYVLRDIPESDYNDIHRIFDIALTSWEDEFVRWYHRLLGVKRVL